MNKQEFIDDHNVEVQIQKNGWPTENSDTIEMMFLFKEWMELHPQVPNNRNTEWRFFNRHDYETNDTPTPVIKTRYSNYFHTFNHKSKELS